MTKNRNSLFGNVRWSKRLLVGCFLIITLHCPALAQEQLAKWGVGLTGGLATFSMSDLKKYQEERKDDDIPSAQIVKSFPPYFTAALNITYTDGWKFFDLAIGRASTGGRISYSDYSGKYSLDMTVVMTYTAATAGSRVAHIGKTDFFAARQILLYSNIAKEKTSETIYSGGGYTYQFKYGSINLAIAPMMEAQRRISPHLLLRQQISYELHVASPLFYDGSNKKLTDKSDEDIRVQAQGLRIRFGIAYMF